MDSENDSPAYVVQLSPHAPFGGVPKLFVDVGVYVFDDLSRACVVTERTERVTHLIQPLLAVRQVHGADGFKIVEVRAVTRQHRSTAEAVQAAKRLHVFAEIS